MKRLAFINFDMSDKGGAQQVLTNMVHALTGYEIHVISLTCGSGSWKYHFPKEVKCVTILPKKARIRETILQGKKKLRAYLREESIQLLFYVGAYAGLCGGLMARRVRCRKVFCDHGALMNQWHELPARLMRIVGSRYSQRTVVLTKQSEEAYYKKFHYRKGRVLTIYNWMDEQILLDAAEYDSSSHRLLTAGRFSHEKGYDLLLKVARSLAGRSLDWEWDIYGEGDMLPEIERQIGQLGLAGRVHLLGLTNHMSKAYGGHAMYVLTSYREGLPLVLIEAKANHLPIVSFDIVSGPGEIVTDGENGVLIPPYDTEKMAEAIADLLSDCDRRKAMSEKSAQGMEEFDRERILSQWRGLITELLELPMR